MKAGRPTVITKETLRKLEDSFSVGATDIEACYIAGISKTTLYEYQEKNPEFTERKEGLKQMLKYQAKVNVSKQINKGHPETSKWYLERKAKDEFSTRNEISQDISLETKQIFTREQLVAIAQRVVERNGA